MKNSWLKVLLATLLGLVLASNCDAKRLPPGEVNPVEKDGIQYRVPHWGTEGRKQNGGYVEAWDLKHNKRLWRLLVYKTKVNPEKERDVQDVFITSLIFRGNALNVTNERGEVYAVDIVKRKAKKLPVQDINNLLDCSHSVSMGDYKKWITTNKIQPAMVSENLNRQLPKLILGENNECIFDPILEFGDHRTIEYFANRASHPDKDDREGYASDLHKLLQSRSKTYSSIAEFQHTLKTFRRPVSIQYFLMRHLQNLDFHSQMELMKNIVEQKILQGQYAYVIPDLMKIIFKENPEAYDKYIAGMKMVPEAFTCFKNEICP